MVARHLTTAQVADAPFISTSSRVTAFITWTVPRGRPALCPWRLPTDGRWPSAPGDDQALNPQHGERVEHDTSADVEIWARYPFPSAGHAVPSYSRTATSVVSRPPTRLDRHHTHPRPPERGTDRHRRGACFPGPFQRPQPEPAVPVSRATGRPAGCATAHAPPRRSRCVRNGSSRMRMAYGYRCPVSLKLTKVGGRSKSH